MKDFCDQFAIVGVGMTPTSRAPAPDLSPIALEAWAARLAIEDAGLARSDIDGAVHTMLASPNPPGMWLDGFSRFLGIKPVFYINVARGGQTAHNGILLAAQALAMGVAKYVVISGGLPAWSGTRSTDQTLSRTGEIVSFTSGVSFDGILDFGLGRLGYNATNVAMTSHGFFASRHMHEYGTTAEDLGAVAIAAREWACLNPEARYHGRPLTMEEYLAAPYIVHPFRKFDCCVQSDLGAAIVLTTAERARDLPRTPVYIKGLGLGDHARELWWTKANYTQTDGAFALRTAFEQSGLTLSDIDFAQFYDCFTPEVLMYLEDYGWCEKGEAARFVREGNISPGGSLPVNTHGGLLSGMYLFDYPPVIEAVRQLRGEAPGRQLENARIGLTNGHGGEMVPPGMCASHAVMLLGSDRS